MNNETQNALNDKIEISGFLKKIGQHWHYLLSFLIIGILIGFLVSKYKTQYFRANASIKVEESSTDMSEFLSIELFTESFSQYNKVLTEAKIVSSRSMIERALDRLSLDVRYYKKGRFDSFELYKRSPVTLNVLNNTKQELEPINIELKFTDSTHFSLHITDENEEVEKNIESTFNEVFEFQGNSYFVVPNLEKIRKPIEFEGSYIIQVVDRKKMAQEFAKSLSVSQADEKVTILNISFLSSNPLLSKDFVEALAIAYTEKGYEEKAEAAGNTLKFIDESLKQLSTDMSEVESELTKFKQEKKIIDFESVEKIETEKLIELEASKRLLDLRLINLKIIEEELTKGQKISEVSINSEGNIDPTLNQLISLFNELKIRKATLGINFTPGSRRSKEIDNQLAETINLIRENIQLAKSGIQQELEYIDSKIEILNRRYNIFPQNQSDYFKLIRNFEVNQKVISFLMEKKIEASIANASIVPNTRIIDLPTIPEESVSLSKNKLFVISLIISLVFGFAFVLLLIFFDNKVYDKEDLNAYPEIPILGTIGVSDSKEFGSLDEIFGSERTIFKESVKSLRTNMRFIPDSKDAQLIAVTSTISQEGKSFTMVNLAASLTLLGKSVVLVDLDMRKPKIQNYFKDNNLSEGISLFLSGKSNLDNIIKKSKYENLDYILSGPIPPNPLELIQSDLFIQFVSDLKKRYDYVLIDNPPIGIVSDAIYVMLQSDLNLFVVRSEYSRTNFLETAENARQKHDLKNMYFVLNGVNKSGGYYYSKYSQGYYGEKSSSAKKFRLFR